MHPNELYLSLLNEAPDTDEEVSEPIDSSKDNNNKDIAADKSDTIKDSDDIKSDGDKNKPDATEDKEDLDSDNDSTEDLDPESVAGDGDNDSPSESDEPMSAKDSDKKLSLYRGLREIRNSFITLSSVYENILRSDIASSNLEVVKLVKEKIDFNVVKLEELLTNTNIAKSKTYADLQVLFNIYINDLKMIDDNLRLFIRASNPKKKSK